MAEGLFKMFSEKFSPHYKETILLLQYCKLSRKSAESVQEWMARLWIKVPEYTHQENDQGLKEQFINGMNDEDITAIITKELIALKDMCEVSSEQVFVWAQRVKAQRAQKVVLENMRHKRICI